MRKRVTYETINAAEDIELEVVPLIVDKETAGKHFFEIGFPQKCREMTKTVRECLTVDLFSGHHSTSSLCHS